MRQLCGALVVAVCLGIAPAQAQNATVSTPADNRIVLTFEDGFSHPVAIAACRWAYLKNQKNNKRVDLKKFSTIQADGTLMIDLAPARRKIFSLSKKAAQKGPYVVRVEIKDAGGISYLASVPFVTKVVQ